MPAIASQMYVVVDLSDQTMTVRVDGEIKYTFDVSTGRKGYSTPTGFYGIERMHKKYHSKKYDNAPMPHASVHATAAPNAPAPTRARP